jgi:hypothetical protein
MITLRLLHVNVGDDVGVKKGGHDIHLLDFEVIVTSKSEEDTECCVSQCGGKDGGKVKVLHITTSNQTSLVLYYGSRSVAF